MDEIKFLNDSDIKSLFDENDADNGSNEQPDDTTASGTEENIEPVTDDLKSFFDENDDDSNKEEDKKPEPKSQDTKIDFSDISKQLGLDGDATDIESLKELIEKRISNGIDEDTKRIREALDNGVDSRDISEFEDTLKYLHSITNAVLIAENEESDTIRKRLILQDFLNNGVDEKEAIENVKKIFKEGRDIDEAERALEANKKYFKAEYDAMLEEAKRQKEAYVSEIDKQTEKLKKSINESPFMDIDIDETTKAKALKNISEPVYNDDKTGEKITAIQKYQRENPTDFLRNISLLYTLTDGFKSMDKIVDPIVKKRMTKEVKGMEDILKNPSSIDSSLSMVTGDSSSRRNMFKFGI